MSQTQNLKGNSAILVDIVTSKALTFLGTGETVHVLLGKEKAPITHLWVTLRPCAMEK
jgi:hypothetical protein